VPAGECRGNQLYLQPPNSFYPYLPYLLSDFGEIRYSRSAQNVVDCQFRDNLFIEGGALSRGVNVEQYGILKVKNASVEFVCNVTAYAICNAPCSLPLHPETIGSSERP